MDSATKICDQIGVSRENALFFLEGSQWDLDLAMEVCRNQKFSEQQPPRTPPQRLQPLPTTPERQPPSKIIPEQQPPQSREELIHTFCTVAVGTTPTDAEAFLKLCNWNVQEAIGSFLDKYRPVRGSSKAQRDSEVDRSYSQDYLPMPGKKYSEGSSKDVVPKIDHPSMNLPLASQFHAQTGSSSSSMGTDWTETGKSPKEELFTVPVSPMASPQFNEIHQSGSPAQIREETFTPPMDTWVDLLCNETKVSRYEAIDYLERSNWNLVEAMKVCRSKTFKEPMDTWIDLICNETKKSRYEALFYLEEFNWNFDVAMNACRIKSSTPPVKETSSPGVSGSEISSERITGRRSLNSMEQVYQSKLIDSFLEAVSGATREEAITCLKLSNSDVNQAVCYFFDRFSKKETTAAMTSQWQLQASHGSQIGSSSSSVNAEDQTDTRWSLEEAGKQKATVATPRMASSQLDINLKGKAGREDSSTETIPDAGALQNSIMLELVLASGKSGTSVKIPFRSDQTVRDIRDAIDKRTPEKDKDYFLQSTIGENYKDMNTTVSSIISSGSGTLIQTFTDQ